MDLHKDLAWYLNHKAYAYAYEELNGFKWVKSLSRVRLFATPWTVAHQASPSMGFSRQEYWSGLPFSSSGDLPDPGIKPRSPALQADAPTSEPPGKPKWNTIQSLKRRKFYSMHHMVELWEHYAEWNKPVTGRQT